MKHKGVRANPRRHLSFLPIRLRFWLFLHWYIAYFCNCFCASRSHK